MSDLLAELMAEKQDKVLGKMPPPKPLKTVEDFNVVLDNPDVDTIKRVLKSNGANPRVANPTGTVYTQNRTNSKIATMLAKYGNPEV